MARQIGLRAMREEGDGDGDGNGDGDGDELWSGKEPNPLCNAAARVTINEHSLIRPAHLNTNYRHFLLFVDEVSLDVVHFIVNARRGGSVQSNANGGHGHCTHCMVPVGDVMVVNSLIVRTTRYNVVGRKRIRALADDYSSSCSRRKTWYRWRTLTILFCKRPSEGDTRWSEGWWGCCIPGWRVAGGGWGLGIGERRCKALDGF